MVILPIVDAQYYLIILRLKAYVYECNTEEKLGLNFRLCQSPKE